jgi:hypothetical protein
MLKVNIMPDADDDLSDHKEERNEVEKEIVSEDAVLC